MPSLNAMSIDDANLGWLYYKMYYAGVDFTKDTKDENNRKWMEKINAAITGMKFEAYSNPKLIDVRPGILIGLKTQYPGLITGTGYSHETGRLGETKMGFFFDHITGLPRIPGHSVKGRLRSHFPQWHTETNHQQQKQELILHILGEYCKIDPKKEFDRYIQSLGIRNKIAYSDKLFIQVVESIIFDGVAPAISEQNEWLQKNGHLSYKPLPIYERDIFLDAELSGTDKNSKILGMDTITPHENPLKNPIPIFFIKVLPDVSWQFQFNLKNNILSYIEKYILLLNLLIQSGIGSKTNTGYGQLYCNVVIDQDLIMNIVLTPPASVKQRPLLQVGRRLPNTNR